MKGIQNTSTNNFSTIVGNNKKFIVPKFQRDYSWSNEQWDDLWQDVEYMISNNEDHYMGYLVMQTTDDKTFYVIDGQQRFTTITILILAAIKCIKNITKGSDEDGNAKRVENFLSTYIEKPCSPSLNSGQQAVFDCIKANPGLRVPGIEAETGIPSKSIERHIKVLISRGLIEHRGSKKTGGYHAL